MRKPLIAGMVVGFVALAGAFTVPSLLDSGKADAAMQDQTAETPSSTAVAKVDSLVEEVKLNGLVGFGESYTLPIDGSGIVTWAPKQGDVLASGDVAVRIEEKPVFVLRSEVPLYRELRLVGSSERDTAGTKLGLQEGEDVLVLQQFILSAGFDDKGRLVADSTFGVSTKRAIKAWQAEVGLAATGKIDRSQIVYIGEDVRVDAAPRIGLAFDSLTVNEPLSEISATVTSKQKSFFPIGSTVAVDADGTELTGTVTELKRVVDSDGSSSFKARVEVAKIPDGVEVAKIKATKVIVSDAVVVPVSALVGLVEGGWAVELDTASGVELTPVELLDVVDTLAAVTGINEGDKVVIAS